ncbi:cobalamin-binding protein [Solemya pervernicosa gill symbiont]|uniref:Cobalamin-binding protein n=1 Tax=Solemya pervernicosa gill symbiont TaxID=642797 RepID=A0A1T2L8K8_9GAMM|nr:cobalamin-binding protein [Solemya pervernicosa gill symbiont]
MTVSLLLLTSSLSVAATVVVTDDSGAQIELEQPAQRIISLAPHLTELLFAAGAGKQVVATVEYSDYPAEAVKLPRVGSYMAFDLERILALRPDLVIGWADGNPAVQLERVESLGFPLYRHRPRALESIPGTLTTLGLLAGTGTVARQRAELLSARIAVLKNVARDSEPTMSFYQVWHQPLMTIGGEQIISDIITLCGGRNIFADLSVDAGEVALEAVLARNPEVIIASGMAASRPEWLDQWRRWPQLRAVAEENLYHVAPDLLQRAGPRLVDGAEQICAIMERVRQRRAAE